MIKQKRIKRKKRLLTSSCTRNGNWGDPFGVAVLVNCFVRSTQILIQPTGNYQPRVRREHSDLHQVSQQFVHSTTYIKQCLQTVWLQIIKGKKEIKIKQRLLTNGLHQKRHVGGLFGRAVLVNPLVRSSKMLILPTGNYSTSRSKGTFDSKSSLATVCSFDCVH